MNLTFEKFTEEKAETWENINLEAKHSTFLSSIAWINFQKSLGKELDQYFIVLELDGGKSIEIGILYIEIFRRKLIKFAYSPYQPVLIGEDLNPTEFTEVYSQIGLFMKNYIKEKKLTLFRFDPLLPKKELQNLSELTFKASLAPAQAKDMWEKNLEKSEEELRSEMSDSTRHNVNKGEKSGIEIVKASTSEEVKAFADLMNETTSRKGFGNYDFKYFQAQFSELNQIGMMDIFLSKYEGVYLSGALINYYKDTAYYTHGASTSNREFSKLRSPYFLQWEIMQYAKAAGFKKYNMWGIIPKDKLPETSIKSHLDLAQGSHSKTLADRIPKKQKSPNPLQGVSDFKKSLGGYEINYVGAMEIYNSYPKYILHRLIDWKTYRKDRY